MLWHAMPPELNTARLMAGAGPAPMLAAAAGWQTLSAALDAQAVELTARLNSLGEAWTGGGSDKALAAATPMVVWLQTASTQAKTRAMQATAQAAAYTQAMATTPSLPEIAANHITQAVLTATNFFGINTIPIALTEMDYFIRMWNQAALAMEVYQAETRLTRFSRSSSRWRRSLIPARARARRTRSSECPPLAAQHRLASCRRRLPRPSANWVR